MGNLTEQRGSVSRPVEVRIKCQTKMLMIEHLRDRLIARAKDGTDRFVVNTIKADFVLFADNAHESNQAASLSTAC